MLRCQGERDVNKLSRPQPAIAIGKAGLQLDGAGGLVHGVIQEAEIAHHRILVAGNVGHNRQSALLRRLAHLLELLFGQRECHVYRLELIDRDQIRSIVCLDQVPGIYQQAACPSIDRRIQLGVGELHPLAFDGGLIGGDG